MKNFSYYLVFLFFVACGKTAQKANNSKSLEIGDSLAVTDSIVIGNTDDISESGGYTRQHNTGAIFMPVSATITDDQGTFSSSSFDCPNMLVYDKGDDVQLSWGGEIIPLNEGDSPDIYITSQSKSGVTMRFVAYRSSSSRSIYLVICTTTGNGKSVEINFKP